MDFRYFGQDLNSVNSLIKKQGLLEADIVAHRERLNEISRRVEEFEETNHFQLDEIRQKADEITKRYMYDVNILACTL